MTDQQIQTIKCAYADLIGAYQSYKASDIHSHDWMAHLESIKEMQRDFTFIDSPDDEHDHFSTIKGISLQCNCGEIINSKCNDVCYINDSDGLPIRDSDGSIVLHEKEKGGLCYINAPETIKKEIRKIIKNKLKQNG